MGGPHRVPEMICVECKSKINHVSDNTAGSRPNPDDFTICIYCDHLMVFNPDLTLREPTLEEAKEAGQNGGVQEAREFARFFRRTKYGSEAKRARTH